MNKIFKVVWSKVKHCYVVVSEIAKNTTSGGARRCRMGKVSLAAAMAAAVLTGSFAMPNSALAETSFGTPFYNQYIAIALKDVNNNYSTEIDNLEADENYELRVVCVTDNAGNKVVVNGEYVTREYYVLKGYDLILRSQEQVKDQPNAVFENVVAEIVKNGTTIPDDANSLISAQSVISPIVDETTNRKVRTVLGTSLNSIGMSTYSAASNGGIIPYSHWEYIIEDSNSRWVNVNDTDNNASLVEVQSGDDGRYHYTTKDELGNNNDHVVDNEENIYYLYDDKAKTNKAYVFLRSDGTLYDGTVRGLHNEILMTAVTSNGSNKVLYTYWGSKQNDDETLVKDSDITVGDLNKAFRTFEQNDENLAEADIANIKITKADADKNKGTLGLTRGSGEDVLGTITVESTGGTDGDDLNLVFTNKGVKKATQDDVDAAKEDGKTINLGDYIEDPNAVSTFTLEAGSKVVANNGVYEQGSTNVLETISINEQTYTIHDVAVSDEGTGRKGYNEVTANADEKHGWSLTDTYKTGKTFKDTTLVAGSANVDIVVDESDSNDSSSTRNLTIYDTAGNAVVLEDVASHTELQGVIGNVAKNTENITNLTNRVSTNENNIATNTSNIASHNTRIQAIEAGYIKTASVSGSTLTLTKNDDEKVTFTDTNTVLQKNAGNADSSLDYEALGIDANGKLNMLVSDTEGNEVAGQVDIRKYIYDNAADATYNGTTIGSAIGAIEASYIKNIEKTGDTLTITKQDGTTMSFTDNNTDTNTVLQKNAGNTDSSLNYEALKLDKTTGELTVKVQDTASNVVTQTVDFDDYVSDKVASEAYNAPLNGISGTTIGAAIGSNTANIATNAADIDAIEASYIKSIEKTDNTLTIMKQDGTTISFTDNNTDTNTVLQKNAGNADSSLNYEALGIDANGKLNMLVSDTEGNEVAGQVDIRKYIYDNAADATYNGTTIGSAIGAIEASYIKNIEKTGDTLTITKQDGTTMSFTDNNTDTNTVLQKNAGNTDSSLNYEALKLDKTTGELTVKVQDTASNVVTQTVDFDDYVSDKVASEAYNAPLNGISGTTIGAAINANTAAIDAIEEGYVKDVSKTGDTITVTTNKGVINFIDRYITSGVASYSVGADGKTTGSIAFGGTDGVGFTVNGLQDTSLVGNSSTALTIDQNGNLVMTVTDTAGNVVTGSVNIGDYVRSIGATLDTDTHLKAGEYEVGQQGVADSVVIETVDKNGQIVSDGTVVIADVASAKELDEETDARISEDAALSNRIEQEKADRISEDAALSNRIEQEKADRISEDAALSNRIEQEKADRISEDAALSNRIEQEKADRKANDIVSGSITEKGEITLNKGDESTISVGTISDYALDNQKVKVGEDGTVKLTATDKYSGQQQVAEISDIASKTALEKEVSDRIAVDNYLYETINKNDQYLDSKINHLGSKVNKVGAGAAALAALHPMDFDPDDKLSFSAGVGNYAGETATALGAFYRPNEKVMMSIGGTYGNNENMVNMGVSFALDRTNNISNSRTAMAREIVDLREQVATQGQQIAQLVALVNQLVGVKEPVAPTVQPFPDVPANHWAYEYLNNLVAMGVIEGYPDGTFGGDRTMTRYEFATMLFKAMQNGAVLNEQIRQEFNAELGRIRVDRIKGADDDANKIERVRVNNYEDRDDYGSKIVQVKAGA